MPPSPPPSDDVATLGVIGFDAAQEGLYRVVLRHSGSTVAELAARVGLTPEAMREQVALFAAVGVVDVHQDVVLALPPGEAITRLVAEEGRRLRSRAEQLESVRGLLPILSAEHLTASASKRQAVTVEQVDGRDVAQLLRSMSMASTGDLLWLRPDQWKLTPALEVDDWVKGLMKSGRRSRAIYPARVLEQAPGVIRARAEAGEHVRILAEVPCRLAIMGSSAALITEEFGVPTERRLVIRQHSLIGALTLLFEGLWEKAMSVPGLDGQRQDEGASDRRLLLGQLATGSKDEQIARALGLSVRTVRRRVAELLEELGAESRFQAGVEAVRRGWM
ncbi:MAG: LuxR C-terminal-related transcriptional regulator [Nocardioidaceae bacterium]